jgi:microcystin-dependent protein
MSAYTNLGISSLYPTGAIASYLGTSDPSGWVICDGLVRTNTGIYNNLLNMSIGTGTVGTTSNPTTYTPPNLTSKMLYGSSNTNVINTSFGSDSVNLTESQLPSHTHRITVTDPGHTHGVTPSLRHNDKYDLYANYSEIYGNWSGTASTTLTTSTNTSGVSATAYSSGSGSAFSIVPLSYAVNYILRC